MSFEVSLCVRACVCIYNVIYANTDMSVFTQYTYTYTQRTYIHIYIYIYICIHTCMHMHREMMRLERSIHTNIHTHINTYIHTYTGWWWAWRGAYTHRKCDPIPKNSLDSGSGDRRFCCSHGVAAVLASQRFYVPARDCAGIVQLCVCMYVCMFIAMVLLLFWPANDFMCQLETVQVRF